MRNSSKNRRDDLQLSLKSEAELRERNQGEEAAIMISGVKDLRGRITFRYISIKTGRFNARSEQNGLYLLCRFRLN